MPEACRCPSCDSALNVPDELVGQHVECPACAATFTAQPARSRALVPAGERRRPSNFRGPGPKPNAVQTMGILMLIGGILAVVHGLIVWPLAGLSTAFICCLYVPMIFSPIMGILAIVKGANLMGAEAHLQAPPKAIAVMQIINIINGDVINLAMGIVNLTMMNDPEVRRYLRG
jgi:hypothetical protein